MEVDLDGPSWHLRGRLWQERWLQISFSPSLKPASLPGSPPQGLSACNSPGEPSLKKDCLPTGDSRQRLPWAPTSHFPSNRRKHFSSAAADSCHRRLWSKACGGSRTVARSRLLAVGPGNDTQMREPVAHGWLGGGFWPAFIFLSPRRWLEQSKSSLYIFPTPPAELLGRTPCPTALMGSTRRAVPGSHWEENHPGCACRPPGMPSSPLPMGSLQLAQRLPGRERVAVWGCLSLCLLRTLSRS